MNRSTTTQGLTTILLAAAFTAGAQAQAIEIVHLRGVTMTTAQAGSGDGVALAAGAAFGTTRANLSSIPVRRSAAPADDPRQGAFQAGGMGIFYRTSATTLMGTPVEVFHNAGGKVAVTVPAGKADWFAAQVRATQLAQNAGLGAGGREMARAFANRIHGAQGQDVEDRAVTNFVNGLVAQGATGMAANDPRVAAFSTRVAGMDTSTGFFTVRNAAEAKELSDRALGLVPAAGATAATGTSGSTTILGS